MIDILDKIEKMRTERGWSVYRLAELSGVTSKCIYNWYHRDSSVPTITALQKICNAFGITLSQFFAEDNLVEVNAELKQLFSDWSSLTDSQKVAVKTMIDTFKNA